jgi:hypothetical protein
MGDMNARIDTNMYLKLEILTVVTMKINVFWDITLKMR